MKQSLDYYKELRNEEWRVALRKNIKAKERIAKERVEMPEVPPMVRSKSQTTEVNKGLTKEMAVEEAKRCMDCANPTCIDGCPVGINIPKFIKHIENEEPLKAIATLKESSALPAACGRVCPQEKQCEANCFYTLKLNKPAVAIGHLERYAADYENNSDEKVVQEVAPSNGIKVGVVGSGPSGLAFAGDMVKFGYDVTVFEALHEIGGVLKYGIPEFRLPNSLVDVEIESLKRMGVKFETNFIVGQTQTIEQLREQGFKSFYVASGAGLPRFMNIPGENVNGVLSANEYLTRVNLMFAGSAEADTPVIKGKNVAVIGGGNTAMDAVRTAIRMGAENAMIIYRRSLEQLPARAEEVHHAKQEGVFFNTLKNPIEFLHESGKLNAVKVQHMELGEPDASGRRRPIPIEGKTEIIPIDVAIMAIGVSPNPIIPNSVKGLDISKWGTIEVSEETRQSSVEDIYAGGDIVRGGATVILAMGDGRDAAASMHKKLQAEMNN
ncbi:homotetrameric NADPH-dependent glutamate synthase [Balneicella halophila]|uniref:Homotetrameric NADPH-dependent glutamate synthase n=1 Tax=Balneicella halophila TaxID=1537566 RepID=A0A7L4UQZ8_BALHA|nr:homotetrameric NADPH-dependent glutamate synthase [Balneicella halophila]